MTTDWEGSSLVDRHVVSPNVELRAGGKRPDMLILHYTGMIGAERAVDWLCRPESKVSCHYLIDDHGHIVQMVDERLRAWHAGQSSWHGDTDTNSCSIGIEIHNPGYDRGYPNFPEQQMQAVEALCVDIVRRRRIAPARVLGHSDVAPFRKIDPGHKFDWHRLSKRDVGIWVEPEPIANGAVTAGTDLLPGMSGDKVLRLQQNLMEVGYGLAPTGQYDAATTTVVSAFQRHWRPERFDGLADLSTRRTLDRLLQRLSQ
jgi:N-acetylmuramoyl-L-alanine amidase